MSDFLSNLMARSFADAPAIEPRLPSLFEAGAAEPPAGSQFLSEPLIETQADANSETRSADAPISESAQPEILSETGAIQPMTAPAPPAKSAKLFPAPATRPASLSPDAKHLSETSRAARRRTLAAQFEAPSTTGAPTIHVTIGRVEVRAIHSPAPAPKLARPAPPKLSLDEYLQKRDAGAR